MDAGVAFDPGAGLDWPNRLPAEISSVSPATKQATEGRRDCVRLRIILKLVYETNPEVTGLRARRNLKSRNGRNVVVANVACDGRMGMAATALRLEMICGR